MKLIDDLLKTKGKLSFKRVTSLYILNIAVVYAFTPLIYPKFNVLEFVFASLLGYSATMIGISSVEKFKLSRKNDDNSADNS